MSCVNVFKVRGVFQDACCNPEFDIRSIGDDITNAIDAQSIRSLSLEMGWAIRCMSNSKCDLESSIARLASLFEKTSLLYSGKPLHSYKMKVISAVNETCSVLLETGADACTCTKLVSVFMNKVHGFKGPPLNATLRLMSYLLTPTENTGHRKTHSNMKTSKSNRLMRAGISTMQIDVDDANECFLRSPGLKVNFTYAFRDAEMEEPIVYNFAHKVREMLGMETGTLAVETDEQMNQQQLNSFLADAAEHTLDSFINEIIENGTVGAEDSDECIPTPESIMKKTGVGGIQEDSKVTPPRKKPRTLKAPLELATVVPRAPVTPTQKLVQPRNALTSYFKIKRGVIVHERHVPKPPITSKNIAKVMFCSELPLRADEM
jgi:hypothetical protein